MSVGLSKSEAFIELIMAVCLPLIYVFPYSTSVNWMPPKGRTINQHAGNRFQIIKDLV